MAELPRFGETRSCRCFCLNGARRVEGRADEGPASFAFDRGASYRGSVPVRMRGRLEPSRARPARSVFPHFLRGRQSSRERRASQRVRRHLPPPPSPTSASTRTPTPTSASPKASTASDPTETSTQATTPLPTSPTSVPASATLGSTATASPVPAATSSTPLWPWILLILVVLAVISAFVFRQRSKRAAGG